MYNIAKLRKLILVSVLTVFFASCTGLQQEEGGDELTDEVAAEDVVPEEGTTDDFAEFSEESESQTTAENNTEQTSSEDQSNDTTDTLLEEATQDSQKETENKQAENSNAVDEFQEFENQPTEEAQTAPAETVAATEPTPEPTPEPVTPEPTIIEPTVAQEMPKVEIATIRSVQYRANDAGGTLVIDADRPIQFQTRQNQETNQLIVEIPNAKLSDKVRRPLNMKDIAGIIGAVDPYQLADSTTARFVIQMRANTAQPFVTTEGNSLLVISEKSLFETGAVSANSSTSKSDGAKTDTGMSMTKVLTSKTLYEFLDKNNKFYGKKISLETVDMPIKEAISFIADEAGINIIIDDEINADKKINLKLRDIPWDQAFVVILKTNELGYIRDGDEILRVMTQKKIQEIEAAAYKRYEDNLARSPMKFKVYEVNYMKASELAPKVEKFLVTGAATGGAATEVTGRVIADDRANQLIVHENEENLEVIDDIIAQFDQPPPQVLIEGRIIEASDSFSRSIGVNWSADGVETSVGNGVTLRPGIGVDTGAGTGNATLSLQLGTLDILGNLAATLSLSEAEGKIRILSSPRVVALNNEKAIIKQGTQVPVVIPGTVNERPTTNYIPAELSLEVTPQITADSSVIMNLTVKRDIVASAPAGQAPPIEKREAATRVMVKNGQTSIIGGVYQNDTSNNKAGVPWLKDLPIIGGLFRSTTKTLTRNELMIFITPRVINVPKSPFAKTSTTENGAKRAQGEGVSANQ